LRQVTRIEVVQELGEAFPGAGLSKGELVEEAHRRGVRSEMVRLLERLPERRYRHVRELWAQVPEVPVGT
jgi:hypothetical protein